MEKKNSGKGTQFQAQLRCPLNSVKTNISERNFLFAPGVKREAVIETPVNAYVPQHSFAGNSLTKFWRPDFHSFSHTALDV